jgi:exosortase
MARRQGNNRNGAGDAQLSARSSGSTVHRASTELTASRVGKYTLWLWLSGLAMLVAIIWSYWPTILGMVDKWVNQPDYSHGFFVLPIAIFFLWSRRGNIDLRELRPCGWGAILLLFAAASRVLAGLYYLVPLDGWTLPLTIAGAVWLLFGTAALKWSLPSIAFLWFMVPIPYSAERWLSVPLQAIATKLSTAVLVVLGQPAISEGNVILLGDHPLFIEEACSGMRIFVGIFALAFVFILFSNWSWWHKGLVLLLVLPVAIVTNVIRIVATGLLYQWVSSAAGQKFSHDIAGFVMIPLAAMMFWLVLGYLDKLFVQVEDIDQPSALLSPRFASSQ